MNQACTKKRKSNLLPLQRALREVSTQYGNATWCTAKQAAEVDSFTKSVLRRDLRYWLARQSSMQIVEPNTVYNTVSFGSRVTIQRGTAEKTITIAGEDESDPKGGLIGLTLT